MGWNEDRQRAEDRLRELQRLLAGAGSQASPDARLAAYAAVVNAEALLLSADTIHQAMETLKGDVVPSLRGMLGDR